MSKLFMRAEAALKVIRGFLLQSTEDAYLDWACFLTHQSIELALKSIYEFNSMEYPFGSNIAELIDHMSSNDLATHCVMAFRPYADMLASWEANLATVPIMFVHLESWLKYLIWRKNYTKRFVTSPVLVLPLYKSYSAKQ